MYNKKLLLTALKNLNQTKTPVKKKDVEESPLGKLKKGGIKKFSSNLGAKNVLYTKNSLYKKPKKNPLYKKPNYKNKIYDPYGMAFDDGGIIENNPGVPPEEFYKNWYQNRVMPTPEGQKLLEKIRPEALERASQSVPYIYSEELNPDEAGYYDTETQQILLNKFLPEAQIEATKQHEFGHHIQAGDKFYDVLGKPHQYLVEQNIIGPKEIDTGNAEWDQNLKKNYDDITNPDEIHARIMTLRNECGFKPDQVITEKDIEDCFKRKKEAGEALDPDIEDLKGVTKGNQSIVNLLNDMVSVPTSQDDMLYAKNGGVIEIEIDESDIDKYVKGGYIVEDISIPSLTRMDGGGTNPCPPDYYWNGEACVPTGRTLTPIDPNYIAEHPDEARFIQNEAEVEVNPPKERVPLMMQFSNEFQENNPYDAYYEKAAYDYLKKSKKNWDDALGINIHNLPENVAKRIQNNYYKDLEKYVINKSKETKKGYQGRFDKKGNWQPLFGKKNILDPSLKRPAGHGSWDNYGDGSIQMVYPEQFFMGPGAGVLGFAGRAAAKNIAKLANYAPIASAPWLTAGNALNAYFGYEAVRPGGNISKAVDAFSEGNMKEGAVEAGWGALGLLPFVKPTVQGAQILKQLKTPGSIQVLPKSGNYSFLYKSPAEGGLLVGNPNLNGSEQVLTGVTEAFNKFSRAAGTSFGGLGLGEFKIMKQTPTSYGYASTVAEGMTLGDMATVGQTVKTTTPALAPSLLELKTSDFNIDKLVGNFRIPTQGSASMEPLTNQSILQKYTSDPNVQGISSGDDLWGKTVGPRRKTTQSYNTKGQEAKKAFSKDLLADEDYIAFKNRAQPDPSIESFGVPRASEDWKKFLTPTEDLPDALGISVPLRDLNAEKELILTDQLDLQKRFEDELIDFDEYVKKNNELTNKLNTVDEKLNAQKIENIEALSDNEIAANVINDMRENKIELWQTEEGQKRLQAMIDNTPSLEGHTPDTLIEGMASMNNLNNYYATQLAKRNELLNEMSMYDKMYDNGQMSKSDYFDTQVKLDEELSIVDNNISELNNNIKYKAFYGSLNNEVGIQPGVYSKDELPKVTAHELGHFLGSYAKRKPGTTYLDEELKGLDLKRLEIPFSESSEGAKAHNLFGSPKTEYVNEAIRYFNKGSEGTERVPFLAEVRQDMLDKGLIKHEFDPITPDLLKKHYKQYKETKGEKYPLRMYDIIKDKPKNFNIMSSVLNKLPMIVGAGLMIDELTNDDKDSNVSEAGLGLFLAFLSRNPNAIKTSKRLQGLVNNFTKYGNVVVKEMSTLNRKYLNNAIEKIRAENKDILSELGYNPWEYSSTGSKAGKESLANRRNALFHKIDERNQKFKDFLSKEDEFYTEMDLSSQQRRLRDMMEMYQEYSITPEGLQKTFPGKFEGVTTTGTKPVTDLSTGQVVNAEVRLPGAREEYKLVNGKLVNKSSIDQEVIISPEYITALKNSRADVETKIPGAKVFGSSVLVTEAGMPHITGDIDVIITQSDYNKNVKDKFGFVQDYGPAKQHAVYPQHGAEGTLDFNIIHEDANGMVAPFYNPAMPAKTPMEIELFRQFYPEKFQEAATKAMVSGKPIEINMTAKEFMAGIDPQVKTVIDSYETSPYNKWGDYNANKEKHVLRPDILIAYGNPEVVAKGQEAYIKSIVGPKGNLGHQFKPEELTDPVKNVDALLKMEFNGDILQTAQDPKRMQLALNDYYINNTVFSREISAVSLPGGKYTEDLVKTALTEWFPGKGGSVNGIGLNTVQKGNPTHIPSNNNPVIGHRQLGLNLNTSDPLAYVESIIKGTSGNYVFTPEELKIVEELAEKYLPEVKSSIGQDFKSRNILDWYPSNIATDDPKNFLNELSEKTGIRAIRKDERFGGYGSANAAYASVLGKFDEVMDAMMYSLKEYHAAPKTLNERKIALDKAGNKSTSSRFPIKTKEDYQKIYSILDGGARTLESRLMQNERQLEAARVYKENLISKIRTSDDLELIKMDEEIEKLKLRSKEIQSELEYLGKRYNRLNVIQDALLATGIIGGVFGGLGYGLVAYNEREKELKRKKRIEENKLKRSQESSFKNYYKSEKNVALKNDFLQKLPDIAQEWLLDDKWRDTWPTGEPYVITKDGYIEPPKKIKKRSDNRYEWILPNAPYFNDNNEKKLGGETSMDLELTPEEIKDYISRGYLVYEK